MSFLTRQMIWGLAMAAIGVALAALAMFDVLPFGYTATWFGCLFWQVMTGPWYKHPVAQYTHPIKKKHLHITVGVSVAAMGASVLTQYTWLAFPLMGVMMEYTYFRWVDQEILPAGVTVSE